MPPAVILTTATKANATGGTFADTLAANSGDSLSVGNYDTGGARIIGAWGIDSDSVAEFEWYYSRPESTQDTTHGLRIEVPATALGGAATNAAFNLLGDGVDFPVFKSDTATIKASSTAADDLVLSYLTEYDDLPGISAQFATWDQVEAARQGPESAIVGINCNAVASSTVGAYGTARAVNADDDRWVADSYYAILGFSVQTQVTTIALAGYDWGSVKLGCPAGALYLNTRTWFKDLSQQRGKPYIPIMNSNNKALTYLYVADGEASTSPKIDILAYKLARKP